MFRESSAEAAADAITSKVSELGDLTNVTFASIGLPMMDSDSALKDMGDCKPAIKVFESVHSLIKAAVTEHPENSVLVATMKLFNRTASRIHSFGWATGVAPRGISPTGFSA